MKSSFFEPKIGEGKAKDQCESDKDENKAEQQSQGLLKKGNTDMNLRFIQL